MFSVFRSLDVNRNQQCSDFGNTDCTIDFCLWPEWHGTRHRQPRHPPDYLQLYQKQTRGKNRAVLIGQGRLKEKHQNS